MKVVTMVLADIPACPRGNDFGAYIKAWNENVISRVPGATKATSLIIPNKDLNQQGQFSFDQPSQPPAPAQPSVPPVQNPNGSFSINIGQ
jgi:hypothetical protein